MTSKLSRRQFIVRSSVLAGGACVAPAVFASTPGKFKVGAVLELSGDDATGGQVAKRGYELWVKTINAAGGISIGGKKYQVELLVQDCQSQPAQGATATERLIVQENVDALFGAYTSGVQIAMNPIAAKYQTPCIAGSAESPGNWTPHPAFTYGIIPSVDLTAGKSIAEIVSVSNPKAKTAAVVGVNEPFSKDTAIGFRDGVKAAGLELVYYTLFPKDADLTPIGDTIASKKPDIVAVGGHDVLLSDMVKALKGAGFTPKALIEHYGITDAAFVNELHKDADGVMGISVWLPNAPYKDDLFGSAQDYAAAFKKAYGAEPDYTAAGCSAAGYVLVKALEQLGDKPGLSESAKAKLNTLIAKTDLTAFYGPIKFESSGKHFHDNSAMKPFLVQIQDGQVKPIAPPEAARSKAVYPMKAWKDR
jgi:branched-chain amino acid transport system substrate-binding protein